jgi:hypothetical protein
MTEEETQKLLTRFPKLYGDYYKSPQESCMCFGFEVGSGWFNLLWELSEKLEKYPINVSQVKSKFAMLHYYFSYSESISDEDCSIVGNLIDEAEKKSNKICEDCGKPGKTRDIKGWFWTLCDNCEKEIRENAGKN